MPRILFGGHTDPGFFIYLVSTLSKYLDEQTQQLLASFQFRSLSEGFDSAHESSENYSLILPAWVNFQAEDVRQDLHQCLATVAADVNAGRCRVFFDFCNESSWSATAEVIAELAGNAGISNPKTITLISQNRLMSQQDLPIEHICADVFLVTGWNACRLALQNEGLDLEAGSSVFSEPQQKILCLNATPRLTRLHVLLKLAATGLIDLSAPDYAENCQIPYVSFPGLSYEKGETIDLEAFKKILTNLRQTDLFDFIEPLLARTPLRVDNLAAKGNALAMQIDLHHYRNSKLSLVTETGMNEGHRRITEKTMKPLALGQPFITFSHPHSLDCARELGYVTYDDCLDNSYDSDHNWVTRMDGGLASASAFLAAFDQDEALRQRVRETSLANIRWTLTGFPHHYYEHFARTVVEKLTWNDAPNP
jgi:hypothetical protein